jgi:hypothetical protein
MKRVIIIIWGLILIIAAGFLILPRTILKPESIHIHAGFQVYNNENKVDFSNFQYMHEMPCTVNGKPIEGRRDEQLEKAHLHDQVGDVVHVHRKNAKWEDFFKNIKYPINDNEATVYIDGKQVENFLDREIVPYESVVIFIGKKENSEILLKRAVSKERIKQIADKSENCSS